MNTIVTKYDSPIGALYITISDKIDSVSIAQPRNCSVKTKHPLVAKVVNFLDSYFSKQPVNSLDLIQYLNLNQGSAFQKRVWNQLSHIQYGEYSTYGEIARSIKSPFSSRAVGAAVGKNPFLILLPCHRVLGANKKLTGFSAGLDKKIKLLALEGLEFY